MLQETARPDMVDVDAAATRKRKDRSLLAVGGSFFWLRSQLERWKNLSHAEFKMYAVHFVTPACMSFAA